jgi:hypothetical protein
MATTDISKPNKGKAKAKTNFKNDGGSPIQRKSANKEVPVITPDPANMDSSNTGKGPAGENL